VRRFRDERFFGRSKRAFTNHIRHGGVLLACLRLALLWETPRRILGPAACCSGTQFGENLRTVPGRKMVVLFSVVFPLTQENHRSSRDDRRLQQGKCSVYALDARGLVAPRPGGSAHRGTTTGRPMQYRTRDPLESIVTSTFAPCGLSGNGHA